MNNILKTDCYIIAEAGVNHNGCLKTALKLVQEAKTAGANSIKFQSFKAADLSTKTTRKAAYQDMTVGTSVSHFDMLSALELSEEWHQVLKNEADSIGIDFSSSPFSINALKFLLDLGVPFIKIPSGEITNSPLLWMAGNSNKPIILSTGMSSLGEIDYALSVIIHGRMHKKEPSSNSELLLFWNSLANEQKAPCDISLLHCTSEYPAPLDEVNLRVIETLKKSFGLQVGYSDHTSGHFVPLLAVGCGAKIIEKHFTLDCSMSGPDHSSSLEPSDFRDMVNNIRKAEIVMGSDQKYAQRSEKANLHISRQRIVARTKIKEGAVIRRSQLTTMRNSSGLFANQIWDVVGKRADKTFNQGESIE